MELNIEQKVENYLKKVINKGEISYVEIPKQNFIEFLAFYGCHERDKQTIKFASIHGTFEIRSTEEKNWLTIYKKNDNNSI